MYARIIAYTLSLGILNNTLLDTFLISWDIKKKSTVCVNLVSVLNQTNTSYFFHLKIINSETTWNFSKHDEKTNTEEQTAKNLSKFSGVG